MDPRSDIVQIIIAGISGGFIRLKSKMSNGEKLKPVQITLELISAAICSFYVGDALVAILPGNYAWADNFIHFIAGYGGMHLVDLLYKKWIVK